MALLPQIYLGECSQVGMLVLDSELGRLAYSITSTFGSRPLHVDLPL